MYDFERKNFNEEKFHFRNYFSVHPVSFERKQLDIFLCEIFPINKKTFIVLRKSKEKLRKN